MPLAGYQAPSRAIPLGEGNGDLAVSGINFTQLAVLLREHFPDLDALTEIFTQFDSLEESNFQQIVLSLISQAPGFVANVIALAAGEGTAKDAEKLPVPTQIKALADIAELTFMEVGGVGKGLEMIAGLLKTTNVSPKKLTKLGKTG